MTNKIHGLLNSAGRRLKSLRPAKAVDWLKSHLHQRALAKLDPGSPAFVAVFAVGLVLFKIVGAFSASVINNQFGHDPHDFPFTVGGEPLVWWFSGMITDATLIGNLIASGIVFAALATAVAQLLPLHTYKSRFPSRKACWGASIAAMGVVYMFGYGLWFGIFTGAIQGVLLLYVFNERLKSAPVRGAFITTFLVHGVANCSVELIRYVST